MTALPRLMVAPNGARWTKRDHPALPVTISEIVATACACHAAGAGAIHAHVRDGEGRHVLDAGLYEELLSALGDAVPEMVVQVTSEAAGIYHRHVQMALIRAVRPAHVSAAIRELVPEGQGAAEEATALYRWCADQGITVQHILFAAEDISRLGALVRQGVIPEAREVLLVLGRYTAGMVSDPTEIDTLVAALQAEPGLEGAEWMLCAFGAAETECLRRALALGGKARVGFENNFRMANGSSAPDNSARVAEIAGLL